MEKTFITPKQRMLISMIEEKVSVLFELDVDEYPVLLRGPQRTARVAQARQMIWYIMHDKLGLPSVLAGNVYGRDHSTVLTGIEAMKRRDTFKELSDEATDMLLDADVVALRASMSPHDRALSTYPRP